MGIKINTDGSKELIANMKACLNQDKFIEEVRVEIGARIDGPKTSQRDTFEFAEDDIPF